MQKTYIFLGNSGSGKGTQAHKLDQLLKEKGENNFMVEIGPGFRDLWQRTSDSAKLSIEMNKKGELQPEFLAIYIWADLFLKYFSKDKNIIIDGSPRRIREAKILDNALKFYEVEKPMVILLDISRDEAKKRMLSRGREDDDELKIEGRLDWFETDVKRSIDFFKEDEYYNFIEINGEQSIEEIFEEILRKIKLK